MTLWVLHHLSVWQPLCLFAHLVLLKKKWQNNTIWILANHIKAKLTNHLTSDYQSIAV